MLGVHAMSKLLSSILLTVLAMPVACGGTQAAASGDGAPDGGGDRPPGAGAAADAGAATDSSTAPRSSGCIVRHASGCSIASESDAVALVKSPGIAMPAGLLQRPGDDALFAFVSSFTAGGIDVFRGGAPPSAMTYTSALAGADGTSAVAGTTPLLYYVGQTAGAKRSLHRAELTATGMSAATPIEVRGAPNAPFWPQAVGLPDGRVALAFTDSQKQAYFGVAAASAAAFDVKPIAAAAPPPLPGVLAHVGLTRLGKIVLTHQIADAALTQWVSYVQMSSDAGTTWSAPVRVAPESSNVHDAFPIARADSGADLYYLHTAPDFEDLQVYRRSMQEDGTLGAEQRVVDETFGHVEKPQPRRLSDGRLGMLLSRRVSESRYDVVLVILDEDAPAR